MTDRECVLKMIEALNCLIWYTGGQTCDVPSAEAILREHIATVTKAKDEEIERLKSHIWRRSER